MTAGLTRTALLIVSGFLFADPAAACRVTPRVSILHETIPTDLPADTFVADVEIEGDYNARIARVRNGDRSIRRVTFRQPNPPSSGSNELIVTSCSSIIMAPPSGSRGIIVGRVVMRSGNDAIVEPRFARYVGTRPAN